jgi:hypothetical protein
LTHARGTIVDDIDYEYLSQWSWFAAARGYAMTSRGVYMHKLIASRIGLDVSLRTDHRDLNPLNNCRDNLREATQADNGRNRGRNRNNTSGYKGVWWHKRNRRWIADIKVNRQKFHLGTFLTAIEAARAYNKAAETHFGEFAYLNPV